MVVESTQGACRRHCARRRAIDGPIYARERRLHAAESRVLAGPTTDAAAGWARLTTRTTRVALYCAPCSFIGLTAIGLMTDGWARSSETSRQSLCASRRGCSMRSSSVLSPATSRYPRRTQTIITRANQLSLHPCQCPTRFHSRNTGRGLRVRSVSTPPLASNHTAGKR